MRRSGGGGGGGGGGKKGKRGKRKEEEGVFGSSYVITQIQAQFQTSQSL